MANPPDFKTWWPTLPLAPWVSGPNGQNEATSNGQFIDYWVGQLRQAIKAHMPDYAPADALPHIGGDRGLIQGPNETNQNFVTRLKTCWDDWARAGTPLELLVQLYWIGFSGAVIVQQNGLAYSLSGPPVAGQDPTSLLTIQNTNSLLVPLTSQGGANKQPTITTGLPWWMFDQDQGFCSRFAIIFQAPLPGPFTTFGTATFTASQTAAVTWNNPFADTTYKIACGIPNITDGLGGVILMADNTSKTMTGVNIISTGSFTGTADILGYQAGAVSPFADLHPADLARLKIIVNRWKPARATCMGVVALVPNAGFTGDLWDWPLGTTWDGDSNIWDSSASVLYTV